MSLDGQLHTRIDQMLIALRKTHDPGQIALVQQIAFNSFYDFSQSIKLC